MRTLPRWGCLIWEIVRTRVEKFTVLKNYPPSPQCGCLIGLPYKSTSSISNNPQVCLWFCLGVGYGRGYLGVAGDHGSVRTLAWGCRIGIFPPTWGGAIWRMGNGRHERFVSLKTNLKDRHLDWHICSWLQVPLSHSEYLCIQCFEIVYTCKIIILIIYIIPDSAHGQPLNFWVFYI